MNQYPNNLIEESYSSFTRMKSRVITASLVTLVGVMIGFGVYGCKKQEPVSLEQRLQSKIAFVSDYANYNPEICVMNADGSELKSLIKTPRTPIYHTNPAWSPFLPLENKTIEKK